MTTTSNELPWIQCIGVFFAISAMPSAKVYFFAVTAKRVYNEL